MKQCFLIKALVVSKLVIFCSLGAQPLQVSGAIDTTFGPNGTGFSILDVGLNITEANAVVLDSAGRIIVVGRADPTIAFSYDFIVARFLADGSIDKTFGQDKEGFSLLSLGGGIGGIADIAHAVVIDKKGRIVVAGAAGGAGVNNFGVARFTADGLIDVSFGENNGFSILNVGNNGSPGGIALDSEERIILGGFAGDSFAVARFDQDGFIDTTFGPNGTGITTSNLGNRFTRANAMILDEQDRIVVGGYAEILPGSFVNGFAVMRFTKDGIVDMQFGEANGFTILDVGGTNRDIGLVFDSQSRIVLAGTSPEIGVVAPLFVVVARFNANGLIDTSFGEQQGFTKLNLGGIIFNQADSVVLDVQGHLVVAGATDPEAILQLQWAISRFDTDGVVDRTFGPNKQGFIFAGAGSEARDLAIDSKGGIILVGIGFNSRLAIARFFGYQFETLSLAIRGKYC